MLKNKCITHWYLINDDIKSSDYFMAQNFSLFKLITTRNIVNVCANLKIVPNFTKGVITFYRDDAFNAKARKCINFMFLIKKYHPNISNDIMKNYYRIHLRQITKHVS